MWDKKNCIAKVRLLKKKDKNRYQNFKHQKKKKNEKVYAKMRACKTNLNLIDYSHQQNNLF